MGEIKQFEPEKLIIGIMYTDESLFEAALSRLKMVYGEADSCSEEYSFSDYSQYYNEEMSGSVRKRFVSFHTLLDPSLLWEIKMHTNELEDEFCVAGRRRVNLDPCLLSHGKFVMATTKGASFRVPLQNGIYADLSLLYARGGWVDFFWTYFDVKSDLVKAYLKTVRSSYLQQRKQISH